MFDITKNKIKLSDEQVNDLLHDIKIIKSKGLWEYDLEEFEKNYKFYDQLKKLPEVERQRYYKSLIDGGFFEL